MDKRAGSRYPHEASIHKGAAHARAAPVQGRQPQQRPLVGRNQEHAFLRHLLLATERTEEAQIKVTPEEVHIQAGLVASRIPGIVLLGEAGIGKTRLAEELSREAYTRGWSIVWSRSYTQQSHIPYATWSEAVRNIWRQELWPAMEDASRPQYLPLATLVPERIATTHPLALSNELVSQLLEQEPARLWDALLALFHDISVQSPLLIVLDDLQWADESSIKLFGYLVRRLADTRILLVATCRDAELNEKHPLRTLLDTLAREQMLVTQPVARLTGEHIRTLLAEMPERQARYIQQQAAGNPFFAEELARVCADTDMHFDDTAQANPVLPQTISAVLEQRLSRLSSDCQTVLHHAAVLGDAFSLETLGKLMSGGRQAMDNNHLLTLLEEALQATVLTEMHEGESISYHFWHPLLQSRLYERTSAARRARIHRKASDILRHLYSEREEEGAALITHHLIHAGSEAPLVARYARLAGDRAYALSAFPDAERYYRIVLEQNVKRTPVIEQFALEEVLFERLGECTRNQGKFEQARNFYEQALKHYQSEKIDKSRIHIAQMQAILWCEIGVTWYNAGNNARARQCYRSSEQILAEAGLTTGPARAYLRFQQSYSCCLDALYDEARLYAEEALRSFQDPGETENLQQTIQVITRARRILAGEPINQGRTQSLLGSIACSAGRLAEAVEHFHAALALYEQHDYQREIGIVCCNLGDVYLRRAEHTLANTFFRRSLTIAERLGDLPSQAVTTGNLGVLALRTGQLGEAERWLRRSLAQLVYLREPVYNTIFRTYLAIVLLAQNRINEARSILYQALSIARVNRTIPYMNTALVTLGYLRVIQAAIASGEDTRAGSLPPEKSKKRALQQALHTLRRALSTTRMEAETYAEGQIFLIQALILLNKFQEAEQLSEQTLTYISRCELFWLLPSILRQFGMLCAARHKYSDAYQHFERALHFATRQELRLEQARTFQHYGTTLLLQGRKDGTDSQIQRGRQYMQKSLQIFTDCDATLEANLIKHLLSEHLSEEKVI